jgi:hypothetical protein
MKNIPIHLFILLILTMALSHSAHAEFSLRGYMKAMPGMRLDRDFSDPSFDNILHNRLNFRWNIASDLNFHLEGRNRILYNQYFRDYPFLVDLIATDHGLVDLSHVWMQNGAWVGHSEIDRLYLDFRHNNWQLRAGRQRINWGINLVSNPNDLFNTYSFFDIDYDERPGADAIRVQYHTGFASRIEGAWSPAREPRNSVGALLWSVNRRGYDLQAIAGYYHHRAALGLGWAGSIGGAGFKGEGTWFYHLEEQSNRKRGNLIVATGLDYMFGNGTFALMEFLYNGGYQPLNPATIFLGQPLRADNIMFSEYAITLSLQHAFTPVLDGSIALMALPDQESFFLSPSLRRSIITNLDVNLVSQIFLGGKNTIFNQLGSAWYVSVRYSF